MNSLDQSLEWFASRPVDEDAVREAQRKLEALIATRQAKPRVAPRSRWLAVSASAAVAALTVVWVSLTPTPALAFSAIQQQLRDFDTLSFDIDQRVAGRSTLRTRVSMTRAGNVRTEVGEDITVVVNSAEQRVLMLMNKPRVAQVMPLQSPVERDDQLKWLEDIREYQGVATLLPGTRVIDGQEVHGWQLTASGIDMVIWATGEGVPLEMNMKQGPGIDLLFHFEMNLPLAAELFSTRVPAGYSLAEEED